MAKKRSGAVSAPLTEADRAFISGVVAGGVVRHTPREAECLRDYRTVFEIEDMITDAHFEKQGRFCLGAYLNVIDFDVVSEVCAELTDSELAAAAGYFTSTGYLSPDISLLGFSMTRELNKRESVIET